ncbi:CHAT domain-containing protein [Candidatus Albibeggiatoa sp. nov. BB20]|uniref:CHAT domain-containing protein n=1 Tax=Candidatus Albibeggiatoa sp. nov. BB20 TaxID=3162723 RepID=UPI003365ABC8
MGCASSQFVQQLDDLKQQINSLQQNSIDYLHNIIQQATLQRITLNLSIAKSQIEEIESFVEKSGDTELQAHFYNEYANILINQQDYSASLKKYNLAKQAIFKEKLLLLPIQVNIAQNWAEMLQDAYTELSDKQVVQAWQTLQETIQLLSQSQNNENHALSLHLSQITQQFYQSPYFSAQQKKHLFTQSYQLLKNIQTDDFYQKSYVAGYMAQLYQQQTRYQEAIDLTKQAIRFAQKIQDNYALYLWQDQLGQLREKTQQRDLAMIAYQQAIFYFNQIRATVLTTNHQPIKDKKFYEAQGQTYFRLIRLLSQKSQSIQDQKQTQCYVAQMSQLFELFNQGELEEYYQDECLAERHFAKVSADLLLQNCQHGTQLLDEAYQAFFTSPHFDDTTATLYIFKLNQQQLGLILRLANQVFLHTVDAPKLAKARKGFISQVKQSGSHINNIFEHGQQLYQYFIQPIKQQLEQYKINTLLFVSHDRLRTIPFAALHDGEHFLVEDYAVVVLPFMPKEAFIDKTTKNHILLSALTAGENALTFAGVEVNAIHQHYEHYHILDGKAFTRQDLLNETQKMPYSVIHLATHGKFGNQVNQSYLQTYGQHIFMDDLKNINMMNSFKDSPIELLTLSACETSVNSSQAALGFSGIAIQAGAKTALGSLWQVSDLSTCYLMESFYENVQKMPKAQALQQAQIELLTGNIKPNSYCFEQDSPKGYQSPYYWAGFQLVGYWR